MMRTRSRPLLAELHAHTTWSDGELSLEELVDLHGRRGFDVLCVTDHVVRADDPWNDDPGSCSVLASRFEDYLAAIDAEAVRALDTYGLLVVPGLEPTFNDRDPAQAAHAVAIGLRTHVPVDDGIDEALLAASAAGAALVAAHPFDTDTAHRRERLTLRFACDRELGRLVHRHELFNRSQLFGWAASEGLPAVASGDVHRPAHLAGWKTLLPCPRDEEAVVSYLRSARPVYLVGLEYAPERLAA